MSNFIVRIVALSGLIAALLTIMVVLLRPWYARWGASDMEVLMALPGDELWPNAAHSETRAVTIAAAPDDVWPWVAQLGQDRGGFYSFSMLENLVGADMHNADRILGFPDRRPGERLWAASARRYPRSGYAVFRLVQPGRAMAVTRGDDQPGPKGSWSFVLQPSAEGTRLLVRGRSGSLGQTRQLSEWALTTLVFEPAHFVMERRMMLGIKERVEGRRRAAWMDYAEPLAWIAVFLDFLFSAWATLFRSSWKTGFLSAVECGLCLLLLPILRPPLGVALACAATVAGATVYGARVRQESN